MKVMKILMAIGWGSLAWSAQAQSTFLCETQGARVQQLRIYEVNRENRDAFHQRFQDHALRIMKKYDFRVVDMWESDAGDKLQFVYVLEWPDAATLDKQWKAFLADTEWIEIKKRSAAEQGQLVKSAAGQVLRRVSYGPACRGSG